MSFVTVRARCLKARRSRLVDLFQSGVRGGRLYITFSICCISSVLGVCRLRHFGGTVGSIV